MDIKKEENYWILEDNNKSLKEFAQFLENEAYNQFSDKNVVVNLLNQKQTTLEDIFNFLNLSNKHRSENHSFVLVTSAIDVDNVPEELLVVPTLREAGDIIQMEEIERDLGAF
ncbi:ribonuclease Z [Mesonia aquimarina]|uniref:ribonuclease Z n=1 Tax=Mesonia aquimarina TaxID=1504967 RepID=UPI000EF61C7D|nr:ribonuclease Z [Mesonia aquimarina]